MSPWAAYFSEGSAIDRVSKRTLTSLGAHPIKAITLLRIVKQPSSKGISASLELLFDGPPIRKCARAGKTIRHIQDTGFILLGHWLYNLPVAFPNDTKSKKETARGQAG